MRSQLALAEVYMSCLILSAMAAVLAGALYAAPDSNLNYGNAFYDFATAVQGNTTLQMCLASRNSTCGSAFLETMVGLYHLNYARFTLSNWSVSYGNAEACRISELGCVPLSVNGSFPVGCLYSCGD